VPLVCLSPALPQRATILDDPGLANSRLWDSTTAANMPNRSDDNPGWDSKVCGFGIIMLFCSAIIPRVTLKEPYKTNRGCRDKYASRADSTIIVGCLYFGQILEWEICKEQGLDRS
jgi:hypothetical protein